MEHVRTGEPGGSRSVVRRTDSRRRRGLWLCGAAVAMSVALAPRVAAARDQSAIPFQPGDPHVNGCPSGWEALALSDLGPYGYRVPFLIDSRHNGGNGDGIVCGKPFTPQEQAARLPNDTRVPVIFDFRDNDLPAAQ